jgi:lysophospholipase L1-like esterase
MHNIFAQLQDRFREEKLTRILALGSSNTGRCLPGMHWFDCLDLAICQQYRRVHRCINAGVGGDTSHGLLNRFEEDASFYKPHVAFITIGGNDCHPRREMSTDEFESNLLLLHERFAELETAVIFQTYYAPNGDGSEYYHRFYQFADVVRKVATETDSALIDHLARWDRLKANYPEIYLPLMHDELHVMHRGNMVLGVDIVRQFGLTLRTDLNFWAEALYIQDLMDKLEQSGAQTA